MKPPNCTPQKTLQYDRRLQQDITGNKLPMSLTTEQAFIHGVGVHHLSTRFNNVQGESRTYTVAINNDDAYHFLDAIDTCLHPNNTLEQQVPNKHHVSVGTTERKWPRQIHRPSGKNHPNPMSHERVLKYPLHLENTN